MSFAFTSEVWHPYTYPHFYSSTSLPSIFSPCTIFTSAQIQTVYEKHTSREWSGTETSKIEPTLNHCCLEVTRQSVRLPHRPCFAQHNLVPSLNYIRRDSAAHSSIFLRPGKVLVHSKVNHLRLSLSLAAPPWLANRECKVDAVSASVGLKLCSTKFFAITHHVTTCRWKGCFMMANPSMEYRRREPDNYHCVCSFLVAASLTSA